MKADHATQPVTIPTELSAALAQRPDVERIFAQLAPSHQREYARWIAKAKRPQTKAARVGRALSMIAEKHQLP